MNEHLVVVKIGGGVLTDKTTTSADVRQDRLDFVVSELAQAYKKHSVDLLLGNGAGTYVHLLAHTYNVAKGARTKKQFRGMSATHNEVRRLNLAVADALVASGVPAFTVSPAGMLTCRDGIVTDAFVKPLQLLLKNRCVPILHGDTIADESLGSFILSTEKVFNACIARLKDTYKRITVVYIMNEDGVLDRSGNVISTLSTKDEVLVGSRVDHDVSGGIVGKVRGARAALEFAQNVYIIGCTERGSLDKAIAGHTVGTRITI